MLKLTHMPVVNILTHLNRKSAHLLPKLTLPFWILLICLAAVFTRSLLAQDASTNLIDQYAQTYQQGSPNLENWNKSNLEATLMSLTDSLIGVQNVSQALNNPNQSFVPGGALGATTNLIAQLYTPPASGIDYLASLTNNILGKPVYAQGAGFTGLRPLLPIWRGFRNVIYVLSSLFFIILGLMVMLRVKTGPQTVVTIQNAIPKIITTLILVTFSYAIAGLLIDLANLFQALILTVLFQIRGKGLDQNLIDQGWKNIHLGADHFNFSSLSNPHLSTAWHLTYKAVPLNAIASLGSVLFIILGGIIGALSGGIGAVTGIAIGLAVMILIIVIILIVWIVKFFFGLIKCYVNIILSIILAPLHIGIGSLPGIKIGFSSWITNLIANLAVFPISLLFLVLLNIIIEMTQGSGLWTPGLLNEGGIARTIGAASGGLIPSAIGLTGVMLLSKLPSLIPEFIFMIKPSPWGEAINQTAKSIPSTIMASINISRNIANFRRDVFQSRGGTQPEEPEVKPQRTNQQPPRSRLFGADTQRPKPTNADQAPDLP